MDCTPAAADQHDYAAAKTLHEESLAIRRELGDRRGIADSLESLGYVALAENRPKSVDHLLGAPARLRDDIGAPLPASARPQYDERMTVLRAALGDAKAFEAQLAGGPRPTVEAAIHHALGEDGAGDAPSP